MGSGSAAWSVERLLVGSGAFAIVWNLSNVAL
jgi:hypothetical protein